MHNRLAVSAAPEVDLTFLQDVLHGLNQPQKSLSPKWLYDQTGSALFEKITRLPEYYLTRVETDILRRHADALADYVQPGGALVELGSGASVKTRILLDEGRHFFAYAPIDISESFLLETATALRGLYPKLSILPIVGDFLADLDFPDVLDGKQKVGFFPGSTLGNMAPQVQETLLTRVSGWPGIERFIVGVDLVKDVADLVAAYDDAQGVTAAFIRNILTRINRDVGADFDLETFAYRATWNEQASCIDMCLVSAHDQIVHVAGTPLRFARQEPIHVSASRKFRLTDLGARFAQSGWRLEKVFTDPNDQFAVCVLQKDK